MTHNIEAQERRLIHTRQIVCRGFLRPDDLWDIEGRMEDRKTHGVTLVTGATVEPGPAYHGMIMTITLDDEFLIRELTVGMPHVPTGECRGAASAYQKLVGVCIGPGFSRRVKELFCGTRGCVHLSELLMPIATTAFQTIPMARALVAPRNAHDAGAFARAAERLVDTCYAMRAEGPVAQHIIKKSE